jgi:RimJ/RimL family protein N-acetyltransferase
MIEVPELETERLLLREHRVDDFAISSAMWANPEVVRFISGAPSTPAESWSRLLRYAGHWVLLGYGYWVVQLKSTGAFLGEVGFADFKREMTPSIEGIPEAGWVFSPDAHGKGYALEAVERMFAWADKTFNDDTTVCIIDPENHASIRLGQKVGFVPWTDTTYLDTPVRLLKRTRK